MPKLLNKASEGFRLYSVLHLSFIEVKSACCHINSSSTLQRRLTAEKNIRVVNQAVIFWFLSLEVGVHFHSYCCKIIDGYSKTCGARGGAVG